MKLFGPDGELHKVLERFKATQGRGDIRAELERVISPALHDAYKRGVQIEASRHQLPPRQDMGQ